MTTKSNLITPNSTTLTQAPVALNLGKPIVLAFNPQQRPPPKPEPDQQCPYKGLFYFDCNPQDAHIFLGASV